MHYAKFITCSQLRCIRCKNNEFLIRHCFFVAINHMHTICISNETTHILMEMNKCNRLLPVIFDYIFAQHTEMFQMFTIVRIVYKNLTTQWGTYRCAGYYSVIMQKINNANKLFWFFLDMNYFYTRLINEIPGAVILNSNGFLKSVDILVAV